MCMLLVVIWFLHVSVTATWTGSLPCNNVTVGLGWAGYGSRVDINGGKE
jgi:hypothetical protein